MQAPQKDTDLMAADILINAELPNEPLPNLPEEGWVDYLADKFRSRLNSGMEGRVIQELKDKTGIDANQLLEANTTVRSWGLGLFLMSAVFMGGGYADAHYMTQLDEDLNVPIDHVPAQMPVIDARTRMKTPLMCMLAIELGTILVSLFYLPLSLSLPTLALHQIARVLGMAVKGKSIGNSLARIATLGIILGYISTSSFGYHDNSVIESSDVWVTVDTLMSSTLFNLWMIILMILAICSSIVAYILPVQNQDNIMKTGITSQIQIESDSIIFSAAKALKLNFLIYILSIRVPWSLKQSSFAGFIGILGGTFLIALQQFMLSIPVAHPMMGVSTLAATITMAMLAIVLTSVTHKAMTMFDTTKFLPYVMCWLISTGTVNDLILRYVCFNESSSSIIRLLFYLCGLAMLCSGLLCMGKADVRQKLEELQFLASEVSRLGVVIEGAFLEANGEGDLNELNHIESNDQNELRDHYGQKFHSGIDIKWAHSEMGSVGDSIHGTSDGADHNMGGVFNETEMISAAFSNGQEENSYVKSILCDVRMNDHDSVC